MTASEYYIKKLLEEKPTHTKGGVAIEIKDGGKHIVTRSGRAWNRKGYSVYNPCDYPTLFGWPLYSELFEVKKKNSLSDLTEETFTAFLMTYLLEAKRRGIDVTKVLPEEDS